MIYYIFSFDRPMQLDALLSSMYRFSAIEPDIVVQYKTSSQKADEAYQVLKVAFPNVTYIHEKSFSSTLLSNLFRLRAHDTVSFLVDDIVFVRPFDLSKILNTLNNNRIFSFRLGLNLTESKIIGRYQSLPDLCKHNEVYSWNWAHAELDWAYPFSLDGNIYQTDFIIPKIENCNFKAPNSLEGSLAKLRISSQLEGICSEQSILVNLPLNRVQNEVKNWAGEADASELQSKYLEGIRIDYLSYTNRVVTSVHEDWEIQFAT
jgi:hypothetical protein